MGGSCGIPEVTRQSSSPVSFFLELRDLYRKRRPDWTAGAAGRRHPLSLVPHTLLLKKAMRRLTSSGLAATSARRSTTLLRRFDYTGPVHRSEPRALTAYTQFINGRFIEQGAPAHSAHGSRMPRA